MSIFSTKTPKKIFDKLRLYFLTGGKSNHHELFEMQRGQFWMQNNMITLLVQSGHNGEHYRYDFQANRMSALPEYLKDKGDFLEQLWQGFKPEPQTDDEFEKQLLSLACGNDVRPGYLKFPLNSTLDPVFRFIQVDELL